MDIERICNLGRAVVETEAKMISSLMDRIDQNFAKACQFLHSCEGRIAVTGVGKSGHISKKIAATFASTGSPAFFIHPSEAKHGDIGMITKRDVLLALSNSGESEEIISILPFVKRLNIPLITLTGKPHSTLARAATINIDVSVEKEACPLGLAPTSSTTAALVMGDALAMALLEKRGFTETDFALSHPGGTLGRRLLLRVDEIMHQGDEIPLVSQHHSLKEALVEMTRKKLGMTTVINDAGELIGIFTDGDVRRAFDKNADIHNTQIQQVMSRNPKTITRHFLAAEALNIMETYKITSLVVVDEQNKPDGIIHIHDILRAGVV
ncbi:KpsF/GutQ family sugar-phosphate isomerase [Aquicella lusitana]|uniref:Arabinose 5-phosphate isomerase n=1 Tax=Aquicella lusitana TaxID=254246 RepID=A0A370H407_9COXI|nr:KpsF/GutQ family sugar-phosphate isomerase [Aquicella lusitana]RDI48784.1 arabinose-5-phosphate isomerase [Aquicella lusitana]VVC73212.1 Arabinose 5-phosphate isomerase KdsD [Aquicella lusitana]